MSIIQSSTLYVNNVFDSSGGSTAIINGVNPAELSQTLTTHSNASGNIHGVTGSLVGSTDVQTLTNKTIESSTNTMTINGTEISRLISMTPSYATLTITGPLSLSTNSSTSSIKTPINATAVGSSTTPLLSLPRITGGVFIARLFSYCISPNGVGEYQNSYKWVTSNGTTTVTSGVNNLKSESGPGGFLGKISFSCVKSADGLNMVFSVINTMSSSASIIGWIDYIGLST